jgi:hypothetical protein
VEIRDAHALAPRDAAIRARALDGAGRAKALDQAVASTPALALKLR